MTKRLVEIDDELLGRARAVLGTSTIKDTVAASLTESVKAAGRQSITRDELMRLGKLLEDLGDPQVMAKAWE